MFGDPKEYEAPNVVVGAIWMLTNTLASSVAIVMQKMIINAKIPIEVCLLYTSPSPRDRG